MKNFLITHPFYKKNTPRCYLADPRVRYRHRSEKRNLSRDRH